MFKVNRKVEYALIALKHMSSKAPGQLTSAKEICDTYQTPFDPTSRVLQLMTQKEILRAAQGARGGYQILKDLSRVTLKDLSDIIVGPIEIVSCFSGKRARCDLTASCSVRGPLLNLNEKISGLFETVKVADLLKGRQPAERTARKKTLAEK